MKNYFRRLKEFIIKVDAPAVKYYHSETVELIKDKDIHAFFANGEADCLVIFVHGYNGEAIDTWNKFPEMLRKNESFTRADLLFYGYPSLKYHASDHAGMFLNFLDTEMGHNASRSNLRRCAAEKKLPSREYKKIIILAHSLGAVVIREALLRAKDKSWIDKVSIGLYAPAHIHATVTQLI